MRRRVITGIVVVLALLVVAAVIVLIASSASRAPEPPHEGSPLLVPQDSKAATAATKTSDGQTEQDAAAYLASQPAAVWLVPEQFGVRQVAARVEALLDEAAAQSAALVIVIYGLPERDCGNYSAGGLAPDDYQEWVAEIGEALRASDDVPTIVILEPDALALAPECGNIDDRAHQLSSAIDALTAERTWIYLDGGHSNWLPVTQMADLLERAGVDRVRGFATNVSNFNPLSEELAYAHSLSKALGGAHAVIDTSRNGAGSDGQWCNPPGRLVGDIGATVSDDVLDTNLWIKPPGESDGTCNGGPTAGAWWPEAAIELTRESPR